MKLNVPILYCAYNRYSETKKSLNILKSIKAKKIYVCLDGPKDNIKDIAKCKKVKKLLKNTKFSCKTIFKFRSKNLGCKYSISKALDWFFKKEKSGIILEDDILPSKSFFQFCEYGLNKYYTSKKIGMICGTNYLGSNLKSNSYFYSKHFLIWGWATWRHVWNKYDVEMKKWKLPKVKRKIRKLHDKKEYEFLESRFNQLFLDYKDTWDIQWHFNCINQNLLSIMPKSNLVSNIGKVGTHSREYYKTLYLKTGSIDIKKINPPKKIERNLKFDIELHNKFNYKKNFIKKIYYRTEELITKLLIN